MSGLTLVKGDPAFDATITNQSIAADPSISVWASANAGAGKTKVLIDRIARLLLGGADPGRVLAVTYTKAAAAEMQTRLYEKLGDWTIASDGDLREELLSLDPALDLEKPGTLARARALFAAALETPGGLKIQTIHAFCTTILQRFPLEAGVPPGFTTLEDAGVKALSNQAYKAATETLPDVFLQIAALTSQDDDRTLVEQAAKDRAGVARARAAAGGVKARLAQALGLNETDTPDSLRQQALASLDHGALREAAAVLASGAKSEIKLAKAISYALEETDREKAWSAFVRLVTKADGLQREEQIYNKPKKPADERPAVTAAFGRYEDWPSAFCLNIEAWEAKVRAACLMERSALLTGAALAYEQAWTQAKRALGTLDFDDLIAATAALLRSDNSAAQWVLYKLDAGIEHILIDEAQDTNPDQWDLLAPMFNVLEQEARDRPRTRFVVGDEKQSIFSFQGAKPERFLSERARFNAGAHDYGDGRQTLSFDLSFRTGQTILNAVDATWTLSKPDGAIIPVVTGEKDPPFERKYRLDTRHSAYRVRQSGAVELWPLVAKPPKAEDVRAHERPFDLERENSARNQLADRIALDLRRRLDEGFCVWDKNESRPMKPGDVMVLVKNRGPFFHQLIRRLKHHQVPVAGADRIILLEDVGIQDLIALAQFALLPDDDFTLACVLKGAFCGLVDDDNHLFPLAFDRGDQTLWARLKSSDNPIFAPARAFLEKVLNRAGHLPPYEFFAALLESVLPDTHQTGWETLINRLGREVREPVEAFLTRALSYGSSGAPTLSGFLNQISTDKAHIKRELDQEGAGVRVMSVHGAKGLEAPIVILPDTTAALKLESSNIVFDQNANAFLWSPKKDQDTEAFKALRQQSDAERFAEDARLLYVAMTRARDVLIICGHELGGVKEGIAKQAWLRTLQASLPYLGEPQEIERDGFVAQMWGAYAPNNQGTSINAQGPLPALPDWARAPAKSEGIGMRRIAPSALAPDGSEPAALSPLAPDARKRFLRGRLIHELLQRLPDLPRGRWEEAAAQRLLRETDLTAEAQSDIVRETLAVLHDARFAPLFGEGSRAEAAIVGRGPGLPDDLVVNGAVDRLVVTDTEVLVLDFKTNRPPPRKVEDVAPVYLNQMAAYRALLQARWPDKKVRCALLWTDGPRLMELPEPVLDQALRSIAALIR
jgi:ATP-dependent helicase/nuclease subunit A